MRHDVEREELARHVDGLLEIDSRAIRCSAGADIFKTLAISREKDVSHLSGRRDRAGNAGYR